jgi:ferric-dicitrate binding protein FerR (iron transport regulator)
MKLSNQYPDPDHLFQQVCHNRATDEEMEQAESLLQSMEQRMGKQIDQWEKDERLTERHSISVTLKWVAGVAASLLLILSVSLVANHQYKQKQYAQLQMPKDTYDNPEDAAAEAQWALAKFSEAINKAIE